MAGSKAAPGDRPADDADEGKGQIYFRLDDDDMRYFDALRGPVSRPKFATVLVNWAIQFPEKAFAHHFARVKKEFGREAPEEL